MLSVPYLRGYIQSLPLPYNKSASYENLIKILEETSAELVPLDPNLKPICMLHERVAYAGPAVANHLELRDHIKSWSDKVAEMIYEEEEFCLHYLGVRHGVLFTLYELVERVTKKPGWELPLPPELPLKKAVAACILRSHRHTIHVVTTMLTMRPVYRGVSLSKYLWRMFNIWNEFLPKMWGPKTLAEWMRIEATFTARGLPGCLMIIDIKRYGNIWLLIGTDGNGCCIWCEPSDLLSEKHVIFGSKLLAGVRNNTLGMPSSFELQMGFGTMVVPSYLAFDNQMLLALATLKAKHRNKFQGPEPWVPVRGAGDGHHMTGSSPGSLHTSRMPG